MVAKPSRPPTVITPDILEKMDDYMDSMDNSVTNKKDVLERLVPTNTKQASIIATQATTVLDLSDEAKQQQLRIINKEVKGDIRGKSNNTTKFTKYGYC